MHPQQAAKLDGRSAMETVFGICKYISQSFASDPLETVWEGHLQYHVAKHLLEGGWIVELGEPGGANDRLIRVSWSRDGYSLIKGNREVWQSTDLIACKDDTIVKLQLKSYPSIGRKSGRAGLGIGLKKDLGLVADGSCAFVFVADEDSYRAIRWERKGGRGPKIGF